MSASAMQGSLKKLKPDLVTSYDIRPGNGEGLFLCRRFINLSLTYLLTYSPWPTRGLTADTLGPCSDGTRSGRYSVKRIPAPHHVTA